MSTEYRRGIPSTAHVEAATRLELLWRGSDEWLHRFRNQNGRIEVCYFQDPNATPYWEVPDFGIEDLDFRPIRPDGTPVDWEMLDQEVARVGQPQTMACNLTASAQAHGFRADLWQRIRAHLANGSGCGLPDVSSLDSMGFRVQSPFFDAEVFWPQGTNPADILTCWTVYQELKPLYDLVDGAQGEAAMPGDVVTEWARQARGGENIRPDWELVRTPEGLLGRTTDRQGGIVSWSDSENWLGQPLRNFAAVLDAVAERRVAERQATAAEPTPSVSPLREQRAPTVTSAQPEPRRFADVRPDRHAHKHWRIFGDGCGTGGTAIIVSDNGTHWDALAVDNRTWSEWDTSSQLWLTRTIIPTDEQGNPVSWESIGQARSAGQTAPTVTGRTATLIYVDDITTQAPSAQELRTAWDSINKTLPLPTQPPPLPRFTTDELDDVDHSKTTKLDEVTLRRGKLPTVEQIAKYREVRARRTGGTVADALKESRIDCEVAQYVLERWAGGLGDANVLAVIEEVRFLDCAVDVDKRAAWFIGLMCNQLDTSEKPSPTVQRERQEAEERRQRLAELRQRLAAERAAQPTEEAPTTTSRFDFIEPDLQADPAASIRAWEARQAAAKARPAAAPPHIAKPAAVPRRPAIEVVDAEVDGLSRSEAFAALFGRALNGGC